MLVASLPCPGARSACPDAPVHLPRSAGIRTSYERGLCHRQAQLSEDAGDSLERHTLLVMQLCRESHRRWSELVRCCTARLRGLQWMSAFTGIPARRAATDEDRDLSRNPPDLEILLQLLVAAGFHDVRATACAHIGGRRHDLLIDRRRDGPALYRMPALPPGLASLRRSLARWPTKWHSLALRFPYCILAHADRFHELPKYALQTADVSPSRLGPRFHHVLRRSRWKLRQRHTSSRSRRPRVAQLQPATDRDDPTFPPQARGHCPWAAGRPPSPMVRDRAPSLRTP
jgi:hypothetical protein